MTTVVTNIVVVSGLRRPLPDRVQLLTLEPWGRGRLLLRLEHLLGRGDDPRLSRDVTVDLQDMFESLRVSSVRETTLDGSQWLSEVKKLSWRTTEGNSSTPVPPREQGTTVSLGPMQIRTFVISTA
ncbi:lysosomal alpha-mannosidase-like isoform X2 [Bacillus rossius redtenbacheri]|uniref:lysosomal alpha-mannosidase-like isoform X2 n=1 Tax=Bacillus rossius redtenbacheri TaxID=93214 RepID=UPI002FDE2C31